MCGIAGVIGGNIAQYKIILSELLSEIEHRGRKGSLYEINGIKYLKCFLGANRLPIVQPNFNKQPALSPDSTFMVVMNGQIFNYRIIQSQLIDEGVKFDTLSPGDTTVLAAALQTWGISKTLSQLVWEGVFLAIDSKSNELYAARDHIGIKPLYFCNDDETVWFASEIKSFKQFGHEKEIHQVDPGTFIEFSLPEGKIEKIEKWWSATNIHIISDHIINIEDKTHQLLKEAIKLRVPDEPYTVLLSGGIDSSLILKMCIEFNQQVTAYTLCKNEGSPDLPYARQLCKDLGVKLIEVEAADSNQLCEALPMLINRLEAWEWHVVNHAAPMDKLFSTIRNDGFKVVLSGEGADELFFGYVSSFTSLNFSQLEAERIRRIQDLHRTNCQRIDRMSMAYELECRVPFLDKELTEFALSLPARACLIANVNVNVNKKPLREIARDILSDEFSNRKKLSFARGVGYQYGNQEAQSVFGNLKREKSVIYDSKWAALPRYPLEEVFLNYFLEAGYGRASYLKSRSC